MNIVQKYWLRGYAGNPAHCKNLPLELGNPFLAALDEIEQLRDALEGIMKPINLYGGISLDASGEDKTAIRKAQEVLSVNGNPSEKGKT